MAKKKRTVRRSGILPGEARRRSLVTIIRASFGSDTDTIGRETHNYIVSTRRLDGVWSHEVEYRGQTWALPGRVIDTMQRHRASIVSEQRRLRAVEQAEAIVQRNGA